MTPAEQRRWLANWFLGMVVIILGFSLLDEIQEFLEAEAVRLGVEI